MTLTLEGDANDYLGKGLSGGKIDPLPAARGHLRRGGERHHRQRRPLRRHLRRGLHPRHRRRALLRPQLRRHGRRRGRRRPRLRVHDRRPGRRHRQDRPQLRRGHVRRHRLRPRRERRGRGRRRRLRARLQQGDGPALPALGPRPRSRRSAACWSATPSTPAARGRRRCSTTGTRPSAASSASSRTTTGASWRRRPGCASKGLSAGRGRDGRLRGERPGRAPRGGELTMGKTTGFMEFEREPAHVRPPLERIKDWSETHPRVRGGDPARAGRPLHGLRHPLLPHRRDGQRPGPGLPDQQPDPRVERPGLPRPVARGDHPPPQDQQLPRVHRPRLPRAVRGLVHAGHQRASR